MCDVNYFWFFGCGRDDMGKGGVMDINKEREAFERFKAEKIGIAYDELKTDLDDCERRFGKRYAGLNFSDDWELWQAAKTHSLQEKLQSVVLTCNQLKEALEFGAPDLFSETQGQESDLEFQLETEMSIEYTKDGHSGSGYYCWYFDLPEEGSILLGTELAAQEPTND